MPSPATSTRPRTAGSQSTATNILNHHDSISRRRAWTCRSYPAQVVTFVIFSSGILVCLGGGVENTASTHAQSEAAPGLNHQQEGNETTCYSKYELLHQQRVRAAMKSGSSLSLSLARRSFSFNFSRNLPIVGFVFHVFATSFIHHGSKRCVGWSANSRTCGMQVPRGDLLGCETLT
uniref:Uncharacterized protein n=1 Tax=Craspedostauros australis TaxID=1486917 RepID=A0A7R9WTX1_9STRA|mmetsp:Transcript_20470/g.56942  ORF Transcript_20470/g.56942 Transcript_20470/m.56942 type:complete len:177 (+) Transcript_20470:481-1011(+)